MTQMTIRRLARAAALALAALAAPAGAGEVTFEGSGYLTGVAASCGSFDWLEDAPVRASFQPAGIGDNGDRSRLALFARAYAQGYEGEGEIGRTWTPVTGGEVGPAPRLYDVEPRLRIAQQVPQDLSQTTAAVRIRGGIRNFAGIAGCELDFDLQLVRRVW